MNTKRMILLVSLIMLASCSKRADPGGASTVGASAETVATQGAPATPVRNGPYVVCDIEGSKNYEPVLPGGNTLKVGDKIDIGTEATGYAGMVAEVNIQRDNGATQLARLQLVGCCEGRTLATTYQVDKDLHLITIVDDTAGRGSRKICPDYKSHTPEPRAITVRFCYRALDDKSKPAWECPKDMQLPHGGDVHAVNP